MALHHATVKAVPSGDTLVLVGKPSTSGPPQEMTLTLASIQAPRVGRGPHQSDEDAFAFESREFLRKLTIGKPVVFCILHGVSSIKKFFGDVDLIDTSSGTTVPLSVAVVEAGWASVKESKEGKDSAHHNQLLLLEQNAKDRKIGIFTKDPILLSKSIRSPIWSPTAAEINTLFNKYENKPTKSIIEYVRDGASLRVYVVEAQAYVVFSLSGVLAPRQGSGAKSPEDDSEAGSDPYHLQSKLFTELRILGREVDVVMESLDAKANVIYGTILHPRGCISLELVRNGLAKLLTDRASLKSDYNLALLKAEQEAKANKRFIWEEYTVPPVVALKGPRMFTGTCIEAISGDAILVVPDESSLVPGGETKVFLSHIRAPRIGVRGAKITAEFAPWSIDSREFIRSAIVGAKVFVTINYEKNSQSQSNTKRNTGSKDDDADGDVDDPTSSQSGPFYGTVQSSLGGRSLGMSLISEGLALCARVRKDDPRSADYDALQIEEAEAAIKKIGIHCANSNGPLTFKYAAASDISTDGKNAKTVFSLLPKGTLGAIVEYVYTGSRIRVYVPSENCILQFSLGQVRSPLLARSSAGQPARVAEPFSEEARQFSRFHLLQRQVEIVCDDIDKNGVVLGRLYTVGDYQRTPFTVSLLDAGLARIDTFAFERFTDEGSFALPEAQATAKASKRGIWSLASSEEEEIEKNITEGNEKSLDTTTGPSAVKVRWGLGALIPVQVSEIVDGATFYVNESDSLPALRSLSEELAAYAATTAVGMSPDAIKVGMLATCVEPGNKNKVWCRVRIDEVEDLNAYVTFIDYGSKYEVQLCDLVPLTGSTVSIHVLSVPPFARLCKLALVRAPSNPVDGAADLFSSFSDASAKQLHSLSWDRPLKALILGTEKVESRSMSSGSKGKDKSQNAASMTTYVALYPDSYTLSELEAPVFPVIDRDASDVSPVTDLSTADTVSFNAEMLAEGLVTLSLKAVHAFRKGPRKGTGLTLLTSAVSEDFIQKLEAAEATVKRSHFNLYKYGDPIGNSDDDFGEPYGFTRGKGFEGGAKQSQGTSSATTSASQAGKKK